MGKIWELDMRKNNGKQAQSQNSNTWIEKERFHYQPNARRRFTLRRISSAIKPEPQRICGKGSQESDQLRREKSCSGGIAGQLIELLENQVAARRLEIDLLEQKISELKAIATTLEAIDRPHE